MIEVALLGAGSRGMFAYGSYAQKRPDEIRYIAVAEPDEEKRSRFAEIHGIGEDMQFESWTELLALPKLCEAIVITTQDRYHYEPTMKALSLGYHILLEKPMSPDPLEALEMAEEAEKRGRILSVCHTMRYSNFFGTLKKLIDQGAVGKVMTIQWTENVGFWHQAHSFVRGNWRNSVESSPMLLQKCTHDIDMISWLINGKCQQVSSFGALSYFKEENAPEGSTARCTDGCKVEHECPYSALKWYFNEKDEWPQNVVSLDKSLEARLEALKTGPYGRCVFRCDNDVVDHQVVNMLFEDDITVAFTMHAFSNKVTRSFKIMGTTGELRGYTDNNEIEILHFSGKREVIIPETIEGGHDGADTLIMQQFIRQVENGDPSASLTNGMTSANSHLIVFAAEESRLTGKTVSMDEYVNQLKERQTV